jgi:hypothetical protein
MTGTDFFFKNLNYQTLTCTSQCGLFTKKSVPVIIEPPCNYRIACLIVNYVPILIALFKDVEDAFLRREVPLHCSGLALL